MMLLEDKLISYTGLTAKGRFATQRVWMDFKIRHIPILSLLYKTLLVVLLSKMSKLN